MVRDVPIKIPIKALFMPENIAMYLTSYSRGFQYMQRTELNVAIRKHTKETVYCYGKI